MDGQNVALPLPSGAPSPGGQAGDFAWAGDRQARYGKFYAGFPAMPPLPPWGSGHVHALGGAPPLPPLPPAPLPLYFTQPVVHGGHDASAHRAKGGRGSAGGPSPLLGATKQDRAGLSRRDFKRKMQSMQGMGVPVAQHGAYGPPLPPQPPLPPSYYATAGVEGGEGGMLRFGPPPPPSSAPPLPRQGWNGGWSRDERAAPGEDLGAGFNADALNALTRGWSSRSMTTHDMLLTPSADVHRTPASGRTPAASTRPASVSSGLVSVPDGAEEEVSPLDTEALARALGADLYLGGGGGDPDRRAWPYVVVDSRTVGSADSEEPPMIRARGRGGGGGPFVDGGRSVRSDDSCLAPQVAELSAQLAVAQARIERMEAALRLRTGGEEGGAHGGGGGQPPRGPQHRG